MNAPSPHSRGKLIRDRFKRSRQRISRGRFTQELFAFLAASYIRLVHLTARRKVICHPSALPYFNGEKQAIFAFWHGRLPMVAPFKPKSRPLHVLISHHNDGELIALTLKHFDIRTVRGSTSSGGRAAARNVIRLMVEGSNITITPDGPRGPNHIVQAGIVTLARLCNAPIIPVAVSCSRHTRLRSWDRMQVGLPFGRMVICVGEAMDIPDGENEEMEEVRQKLETALNQATADADRGAGLPPEED